MRRGIASSRRVPSYAIFLLLSQLYQEYNQRGLPPVTLSVIIGEILIYFRAIPLPWNPSISDACLSAHKILRNRDYFKIFVSQVEHGDDWHLYYNMVSFMFKGQDLESRMGSTKYALLLGLFTLSTGLTYVGLNYGIGEALGDDSYLYRCAVGFSGVIFALKVLTTHEMGRDRIPISILGIPLGSSVNAKYYVWIELFLISLVTPNASFVGHLAGILVGLAYVYGPLKIILDTVHGPLSGRLGQFPSRFNSRFTSTSQSSGYRNQNQAQGGIPQNQYTQQQTPYNEFVPVGMTEDDQMRRAMEESLRNHGSGSGHSSISRSGTRTSPEPIEEIRRKRLTRFT